MTANLINYCEKKVVAIRQSIRLAFFMPQKRRLANGRRKENRVRKERAGERNR